jgi:hypothetical protein
MANFEDVVNGVAVLSWGNLPASAVFVVVCEDDRLTDRRLLSQLKADYQVSAGAALICKRSQRITTAVNPEPAFDDDDDDLARDDARTEAACAAAVRAYRALAQDTNERIEAITIRLTRLATDLYMSILQRYLAGAVVAELAGAEDGRAVAVEAADGTLRVAFSAGLPPFIQLHLARQFVAGRRFTLVADAGAAAPSVVVEYTTAGNIDGNQYRDFVYFRYGLLVRVTRAQ